MQRKIILALILCLFPLPSYALNFTGSWVPIQGIIESVNPSTGEVTVINPTPPQFQSPTVNPPPPAPPPTIGNVGDHLIKWGNPPEGASSLAYSALDVDTKPLIFTFGTIFFDNTSISIPGDDGRDDLILGVILHLDQQLATDASGTEYTVPAKNHLILIHNVLNSLTNTDFLDIRSTNTNVGDFISKWNEATEGASHSATIQGSLELNGMPFGKELFPVGVTATSSFSLLQSASFFELPQEPIELNLVNLQFGEVLSGGGTITNAPIPEPSTILLMATGLIALGIWRGKLKF